MGSLGLIPDVSVKDPGFIVDITGPNIDDKRKGLPISIDGVKELHWKHFEALIAIIYERESREVILNAGTNDSGVDIVVIGSSGKNILIQCKYTSRETFNSASAVQYTYGAKPQCEKRLSIKIDKIILHSNAKSFSKRARATAKSCNVDLLDWKWLRKKLKKHHILYSDILKMDLRRKRIGS